MGERSSGKRKDSENSVGSDSNPHGLAGVVHENVRSIQQLRDELADARTYHHRFAEAVFRTVGSMRFIYFELVFLTIWFLINTGNVPFISIFDEYPFVFLATILAAKAIFITVFILYTQNRQSIVDKKREDLNLQITLLTEHEVTRLIGVTHAIAKHFKIPVEEFELQELKQEVKPEKVIDVIEDEKKRSEAKEKSK